MPDRISRMLDSMITAVDDGFSYDGILSIPETGLEDIAYRTGLPGLLDDSVDVLRAAKKGISRVAGRIFKGQNSRMRKSRRLRSPLQPDPFAAERLPRKRIVYGGGEQGRQSPRPDVDKGVARDEEKQDPQLSRPGMESPPRIVVVPGEAEQPPQLTPRVEVSPRDSGSAHPEGEEHLHQTHQGHHYEERLPRKRI